jgi:hypothetical protein
MGSRLQEYFLLTSINLTIYIYCSVKKGNQNTFAIALTLHSLHYFTYIFILHIYIAPSLYTLFPPSFYCQGFMCNNSLTFSDAFILVSLHCLASSRESASSIKFGEFLD